MIQVIIHSIADYGPLWYRDESGNYHQGATEMINGDAIIRELCQKMEEITATEEYIWDYFEKCAFNSKGVDKLISENVEKMYPLIEKLEKRLDELNDGSFEIEDWETYKINQHMINKKKIVRTGKAHLEVWNDYGAVPPFWDEYDDYDDQEEIPDAVWEDKTILELGEKTDDIYCSFLDWDDPGHQPEGEFEEREKTAMPEMLDLYKQIRQRLIEINDGSYDIIDIYPIELLINYGSVKKYWFLDDTKTQTNDNMKEIIIFSEYCNGPLWYRDSEGNYHQGATDKINNDYIVKDLVYRMTKLNVDWMDKNEKWGCVTGHRARKKYRSDEKYADKMYPLLYILKERIEDITNGQYEIEDWETANLNSCYQIHKYKRKNTGKVHLELINLLDNKLLIQFNYDDDRGKPSLTYVKKDPILIDISKKADDLFWTFYNDTKKMDADEETYIVEEREKRAMPQMLNYYKQLRARLIELNKGFYDIYDIYSLELVNHYGDVKAIIKIN